MLQTGLPLSNGCSWLFASRCNLVPHIAERAIEDVVRVSRVRNQALGVTGALLFNEQRFVQYLEGPEPALAELRISIERDQRHADISTIADRRPSHRLFQTWSLVYSGSSVFIASRIDTALTMRGHGEDQVLQLLKEFSGRHAD